MADARGDGGRPTPYVRSWRIEPAANRLIRDAEEVRLEPKVMEVLVCLVEHAGDVVSKDRFMDEVWGDTVVTNDVLARCISELRKVLGDDARDPYYIETIRKRGYRLIAPVTYGAPSAGDADAEPLAGAAGRAPRVRSRAVSVTRESLGRARQEAEAAAERGRRALQAMLARRSSQSAAMRGWLVGAVVVALLVVTGLWIYRNGGTSPPAPPETVPFTSFPGEELDSELAPDGERVAFAWNGGEGDDTDIYVKQPGAEAPLRLSSHPGAERSPAWSPDGQRVAFVRAADGEYSVVLVPSIGGSEQVAVRLGRREVQSLTWSPDGRRLALAAQDEPYGAYSVYLLGLDSLRQRRLTEPPAYYYGDLEPAFSPDGQTVAFVRSVVEHVQDVYTVPVGGGEPRRLTRDEVEVAGLDWTADGSRIVFASEREGASKLWRVPPTGGTPEWVATAGGGSGLSQPSVARAGQRMTFTERSHEVNIWRLKPVGSMGRMSSHRVIFSTRWDSNPDVSPDENYIAFASKRSGSFEVWVSGSDGTDPVQLTTFGGAFTSTPRWSPSGDSLAFMSRANGDADVYVMGVNGSSPRPLTTTDSDEVAPRWSRDGRWVYFASNRSGAWQVWRRTVAGDTLQQVTRRGGFAALEAAGGDRLFYVKKTEPGIWTRSLQTPWSDTTETRLVEDFDPKDWGNWAVTGEGVYYVRRTAQGPTLSYYGLHSGRTTALTTLESMPQHPSLGVAPGGAWFLFSRVDRSESDIMLVENFR